MPHSATDFLAVSLFNNCLSYKLTLFPLPSRPFGKRKRRLPTTSVVQRKLEGTALSARHRFSRSLCTSGEGGPVVRERATAREDQVFELLYGTSFMFQHISVLHTPTWVHSHRSVQTSSHIHVFCTRTATLLSVSWHGLIHVMLDITMHSLVHLAAPAYTVV